VSSDDLKRGLILHFNFDAAVGEKVHDLSGHGNEGEAVGIQWVANGHRGGSVRFGLTNSYIRVPNNDALNPPQLTLAAWIKTSYKDWVWRRIFDKCTGRGYDLTMGGDMKGNSWQGQVALEAGPAWVTSRIQVADGRWHHVAGTFDGSELRLYVDGQPAGKPVPKKGELARTAYDLTIGANRSNPNAALGEVGASFNGMMDDVMMFNRALSAKEVRMLFESQVVAPATGRSPSAGTQGNPDAIERLKQAK
jgi:hypothetical protein